MVMSIIVSLYLILFITHFIIRSWWKQNRYKSLPPGPTPMPVLGTPKYMDLRYAKRNFTKLSQKYGSVFTIWKKSEPVIVLCGYDTVKDGLMDNAEYFCERPYIPVVYSFSKGYDVNGPRWRSLRRFTVDFLRKYGMGKKVMEMRILEESKYLVQAVAESGGKVFNPTMALSCAVGNTMGGMMFGLHFDYKDKQLHDLLFSITKHIRGFVSPLSTVVCHNFMGHVTICSRPFRNIALAAG